MEACVEELVAAVRRAGECALETPADVRALLAARDLLDAEVCASIGRLDRSGAVVAEGAGNTVQWLSSHGGGTSRDAAALVKRAGLIAECTVVGDAWARGGL